MNPYQHNPALGDTQGGNPGLINDTVDQLNQDSQILDWLPSHTGMVTTLTSQSHSRRHLTGSRSDKESLKSYEKQSRESKQMLSSADTKSLGQNGYQATPQEIDELNDYMFE